MIYKVPSKPSAILVDVVGVFATKENAPFSETRKRFYREYIDRFVKVPFYWEKDRSSDKLCDQYGNHGNILAHILKSLRRDQERRLEVTGEGLKPEEPKLVEKKDNIEQDRSKDHRKNIERDQELLMKYMLWAIDNDKKRIQVAVFLSSMTKWGYGTGLLKTTIYRDVYGAVRKWHDRRIPLYLNYPSMLFDKTVKNAVIESRNELLNLREYFKGSFLFNDEHARSILGINNVSQIVFMTHSAKTANEAANIGYRVVVIVRPDIDPNFLDRIREQGRDDSTIQTTGTGSIAFGVDSVAPTTEFNPHDYVDEEVAEVEVRNVGQDIQESTRTTSDIFSVNSIVTYSDTQRFPIIRSLDDIKIP